MAVLNQEPRRTHKAKNGMNSTKEFSEEFEGGLTGRQITPESSPALGKIFVTVWHLFCPQLKVSELNILREEGLLPMSFLFSRDKRTNSG